MLLVNNTRIKCEVGFGAQTIRIYFFFAVYQPTATIMFTQTSTGTMSAIDDKLPNIVRSIPLLV